MPSVSDRNRLNPQDRPRALINWISILVEISFHKSSHIIIYQLHYLYLYRVTGQGDIIIINSYKPLS